ncbi:class I SAM-dependent methyltransferase [Aquabacterium sp.]|uniref:class I SAM-dependent methyltransferase n=1 Tax=Aquabacterium sp. TaxID=1872578 RepID=UPI002C10E2B9|nr:methyltransferase domain-containing protein [Aquabacterium sp.]HSW07424.1 methyltransferase domain-containing protein [Aquabacterium sp.]
MLFRSLQKVDDDALFVHVHVPRTGGTSLRLLLSKTFGSERCLMNYAGEIDQCTTQQLSRICCVSGHVEYGMHRHFARAPLYLTVLRHPIDRYRSTYATFLGNPKSPYHEAACRLDINAFLREALDSDVPGLRRQLHNLQCRLVCGEPSFGRAREFIDERYFLAAPFPRLADMVHLLWSSLGCPESLLPRVHDTEALADEQAERMQLSPDSIDLLMQSEAEDALLYSHVQKSFAALVHACRPASRPLSRALPSPPAATMPPPELRFMAESDDVFFTQADGLAGKVLGLVEAARGSLPRRLLDIGCGYGRLAYGLRRAAYDGRYEGFDILQRHIGWLNEHFAAGADDAQRYRFDHVDHHNERYNPAGGPFDEAALPYAAASFDTLVSLSVFTHMDEHDLVRYLGALSRLLATGGTWVTTFFCLPSGFTLQDVPGDAALAPTAQVSEHAFVHSASDPLHVIAYTEDFLLRQFARHGLEVIDQRKGSWLTRRDALEGQDWFVLRKREAWSAREIRLAQRPSVRCNICGSTEFGLGPNDRTSVNGQLPRCLQCGSLERHRIARRVFQALPHDFINWRRALQFSPDGGLDGGWFRSWELSVFEGANSLDIQAIDRPDASYDFLSLSHVLESVPDDRIGFDELCRILSPAGLLHVTFGAPLQRDKTLDLDAPQHAWKAHHLYGRDLTERFGCARKGLGVVVVEAADPCTGVNEPIHLFMKDPADVARVHDWLRHSGEPFLLS